MTRLVIAMIALFMVMSYAQAGPAQNTQAAVKFQNHFNVSY